MGIIFANEYAPFFTASTFDLKGVLHPVPNPLFAHFIRGHE
jgi:hypothetical protein